MPTYLHTADWQIGRLFATFAFVAKRIGQSLWDEFLDDLERNKAFTLSPSSVWT